jgi:hypothetical protein
MWSWVVVVVVVTGCQVFLRRGLVRAPEFRTLDPRPWKGAWGITLRSQTPHAPVQTANITDHVCHGALEGVGQVRLHVVHFDCQAKVSHLHGVVLMRHAQSPG